jgi:hypothetical protein
MKAQPKDPLAGGLVTLAECPIGLYFSAGASPQPSRYPRSLDPETVEQCAQYHDKQAAEFLNRINQGDSYYLNIAVALHRASAAAIRSLSKTEG